MAGMTKKLEVLLHQAEQVISNGQASPEIATAMGQYGYDAERWAEGQGLLDTVRDKVRANEAAFAAQLGATDKFKALFDEVWDQSQSLAQLSATLFEGETETLTVLGLHKSRDAQTAESEIAWPRTTRRLSAFLPWARSLYKTAQSNAEASALLADFGYATERLNEEAAELESMAEADRAQEIAKAQSQQSTAARDEAVDALRSWLFRAEKVAKIALKGKRELLTLMGV